MGEWAREARESDLPRLVELCRSAITELSASKGGDVWARREARSEPLAASLEEALASPEQLVVVGCIASAVMGYAVVRIETLHDGTRLGLLEDIYVEPGARSIGIGEALMDQVLDWARERGCTGLDSVALPGDRATKNFFERSGLVARAIIVHRRLEGGDDTA